MSSLKHDKCLNYVLKKTASVNHFPQHACSRKQDKVGCTSGARSFTLTPLQPNNETCFRSEPSADNQQCFCAL